MDVYAEIRALLGAVCLLALLALIGFMGWLAWGLLAGWYVWSMVPTS